MTSITLPRATVEQALEALKYLHEEKCNYMRRNNLGDPLREDAARLALPAITALRAVLAQQKDPTDPGNDVDVLREHVRHLERRVRQLHAQQAEPDHETRAELAEQQVVQLAEERDHYRNLWQKAQQTEPAQEPAFHGFMSDDGTQVDVCFSPSAPRRDGTYATAYYTAPPHRVAQQAEPMEPVAWRSENANPPGGYVIFQQYPQALADLGKPIQPLYTAPPQRKLVPLTEEEIDKIFKHLCDTVGASCKTMARAVEKTSWEKNHGQA